MLDFYTILMSDDVVGEIRNHLDSILEAVPEIKPMIGFDHKHPQHHLDVFEHTLYALSLSEKDYLVRMALLFHDIGKPYCFEEGEVRSYHQHPIYSEKITRIVLKRLQYQEDFIEDVCYLVRYHDAPIKRSEVLKNYNLLEKRLEVQRCDALAHHPDTIDRRRKYLEKVKTYFC